MQFIKEMWCDLFHGGGTIERDSLGRINWQCKKCGSWSRYPIPLDVEKEVVDHDIASYKGRHQ